MLQLTKAVATEAKAVKGKVIEEMEELVRFCRCLMRSYMAYNSAMPDHMYQTGGIISKLVASLFTWYIPLLHGSAR